jgi:hypothetical protein
MQKETAALYYRIYELALYAARKAERAYNYERGHTAERFLPSDTWDSLHEGLMAGERLTLAVKQMEESYLCKNKREYELTKHISLRTFAPLAFLQLKNTGYAEVELPEWLFDLDYPGHYMRRIKNVSVTIPCVTGPYTGIQCRLTLLSSITRVDPRLRGPLGECCEETPPRPAPPDPCACHGLEPESVGLSTMPKGDNGYPALSDDPRIVRQYAATSAIATSAGVNDSGLFELNFRDERYLPFEFAGAVSRWRIEMPPENNYFDFDSLSDFVLHLQYMAREGGDVLAQAAAEVASVRLPDGGVRLFDLRHEWPDAWARLQTRRPKRSGKPRDLELRFARDSFAFLPGRRKLTIVRLDVLFELPPPKPLDCECPPECAEPNTDKRATHTLQLFEHRLDCCDEEDCDCCPRYIDCVESAEWPGLYHGTVEVELGPLSSEEEVLGRLRFPATVNRIVQVFLLCGYRADRLPEFRC